MAQQQDPKSHQDQQRQAGQQPDRGFGSQEQGRNKSADVNTGRSGSDSQLDQDIEMDTPKRSEGISRQADKVDRVDKSGSRPSDSKKNF